VFVIFYDIPIYTNKYHLTGIENPRVTGSIPVSATNKIKLTAMWAFYG
jgi:hypothetical protein